MNTFFSKEDIPHRLILIESRLLINFHVYICISYVNYATYTTMFGNWIVNDLRITNLIITIVNFGLDFSFKRFFKFSSCYNVINY